MKTVFVIKWNVSPTNGVYFTWRSPNRKPYSRSPTDPDTKIWKTRKAAEKRLSTLHLTAGALADDCVIEEISGI